MGAGSGLAREPRRRGPLRELVRGAGAFVGGVSFVLRTPRVIGWALVPAGVAVSVGVGLSALGVWGAVHVTAALVSEAGMLGALARGMLDLVFAGVAVMAAVVVAVAVAQPLARVALERITTPLDGNATGAGPLRASSSFVDSLVVAASTLGVTLPTVSALELVTLFAPEGAFVTEPIAFAVSAMGLAWELLDHPFSRRGLGFGERLRWVRESFFAVLGFAIAAQLFLLIPGIDLLLVPVGVAGATRLLAAKDPAVRGAPPVASSGDAE